MLRLTILVSDAFERQPVVLLSKPSIALNAPQL
jgi:hypothetical protein